VLEEYLRQSNDGGVDYAILLVHILFLLAAYFIQ
jgi:hypothetical protein